MKDLAAKYSDDICRAGLMLATGTSGWLVTNITLLNELARLAVAAVTIVSILIQLGLAVHKHLKDK